MPRHLCTYPRRAKEYRWTFIQALSLTTQPFFAKIITVKEIGTAGTRETFRTGSQTGLHRHLGQQDVDHRTNEASAPPAVEAFDSPVFDDDHFNISKRGRRGFGVLPEEHKTTLARVLAIQHFHLHRSI